MARERNYGWNGETPAKELAGQAAIVFNGIKAMPDTLLTGKQWTELLGGELKTRQDPYRVVLYYLIVLKQRGLIRTAEFDINAVTKDDLGKRAITVKTDSVVTGGEIVEFDEAGAEVAAAERADLEAIVAAE